jgi:hypothetical protein
MEIICSKCKCKYANDEQTISNNFGYNNQNIRFKTCKQCRKRNESYRIHHIEERKEYDQLYKSNNKDKISALNKQYWLNNKDKLTNRNSQYYQDHKHELIQQAREKRKRLLTLSNADSLISKQEQDDIDVSKLCKCSKCKRTKSITEFRKWLISKKCYKTLACCSTCRDKKPITDDSTDEVVNDF